MTHDTDFATLLAARRHSSRRSFLSAQPIRSPPKNVAALIIDNLDVMADDLTAGAIATFPRGHLRSRRLPLP